MLELLVKKVFACFALHMLQEVSCLRLLKKFSPKNLEPKTLRCRSDDPDTEEPVKLGKRGQINDQIVELPIEHQVYDMIDAEGSKGLTITEVCPFLYWL